MPGGTVRTGSLDDLLIMPRMMLQLEKIEYQMKETADA
jgi:hypothetical protein